MRGPAAQAGRARPTTREPWRRLDPNARPADEWRLATTVGKILAVIVLLLMIAFGTMVVVTVTSEPGPAAGADDLLQDAGWMDGLPPGDGTPLGCPP